MKLHLYCTTQRLFLQEYESVLIISLSLCVNLLMTIMNKYTNHLNNNQTKQGNQTKTMHGYI